VEAEGSCQPHSGVSTQCEAICRRGKGWQCKGHACSAFAHGSRARGADPADPCAVISTDISNGFNENADNIYLVASLTQAHNAFDALAASTAKNLSAAVSTSQSYIYLPWHDEADWRSKRDENDAIKMLRETAGKKTLPLEKDGFTCLRTHIGSADFRQACFRKMERQTQDLLKRMRPLTDNKLHTLMLTHNVTSKFIHSQRTSLHDDTSLAHFQNLDAHIQVAFLDGAVPGWRDSATHSEVLAVQDCA